MNLLIRTYLTTLLAALALVACGGGGGDSSSQSGSSSSQSVVVNDCSRQTYTQVGNYSVSANNWGILSGTQGYTNCVTMKDAGNNAVSATFNWNFGNLVGTPVLAYPSVNYGAKPGQPATTTALPKALSQLNSFVVSWDYTLTHGSGSDSGNVLIDNWITSTPNHIRNTPNGYLASEGVAVELMIFLDNWGSQWATYYLKWPIVTINGKQYYFYGGLEQGSMYAASFFPVSKPGSVGSLDLVPFLNYLTANNLISNSLYFANTEFGNEIKQGSGAMTINSYSVQQK